MKVEGATRSLLQGVSQQPPSERGLGQHTEQVNMLPDGVRGLVRRHGSSLVAEVLQDATDINAIYEDLKSFRTYRHMHNGVDYDLLVRRGPKLSFLPFVLGFNRTAGTWMSLHIYHTALGAIDPVAATVEQHGVSAITSVGRMIFAAGHETRMTSVPGDFDEGWQDWRSRATGWVKSGAQNRTYTIRVQVQGMAPMTASYTTPNPTYPGTVDISSVSQFVPVPGGTPQLTNEVAVFRNHNGYALHELANWNMAATGLEVGGYTNVHPAMPAPGTNTYSWDPASPRYLYASAGWIGQPGFYFRYTHNEAMANPSYTAQVNQLQSEYNLAATQWMLDAAQQSTPSYIADRLVQGLISAGFPNGTPTPGGVSLEQRSVSVNGPYIFIQGGRYIDANGVRQTVPVTITMEDSGDNSSVAAMDDEVTSIADLTDFGYVRKVVRIKPTEGDQSFYVRATNSEGYNGRVRWVEYSSEAKTMQGGLLMMYCSGNRLFVAGTAGELSAIHNTVTGSYLQDVPTYARRLAGDDTSNKDPFFIGRKIDYLGTFQDRLIVGSSGRLCFSGAGDYLNFYKTTMVTVPASDPFGVASAGNESDRIFDSTAFDKSLIFFGERNQYVVSGESAITPVSAVLSLFTSNKDAILPITERDSLWFAMNADLGTSIHTVSPNSQSGRPETFSASEQLSSYLEGRAIELCSMSKPGTIFVRSDGDMRNLYLFSYADRAGKGRVQAAWHRWTFGENCGAVAGMTPTVDGLYVFSLREDSTGQIWAVADLIPMSPGVSDMPYLDSRRTWAAVTTLPGSIQPDSPGDHHIVFSTGQRKYLGAQLAGAAGLLAEFPDGEDPVVGVGMVAEFEPTPPFITGEDDKVVTSGRLIVTRHVAHLQNSSGFETVITQRDGSTEIKEYTARVVGAPDNRIGYEPVRTYQQNVPIGRANTDYRLRFRARKWMPFNLIDLKWIGQYFNRTQRR